MDGRQHYYITGKVTNVVCFDREWMKHSETLGWGRRKGD